VTLTPVQRCSNAIDAERGIASDWLPETNDPAEGGDVDLTAEPALIADASQALGQLEIQSHETNAQEFFRSRWAG
jgi:hypothetical protein